MSDQDTFVAPSNVDLHIMALSFMDFLVVRAGAALLVVPLLTVDVANIACLGKVHGFLFAQLLQPLGVKSTLRARLPARSSQGR